MRSAFIAITTLIMAAGAAAPAASAEPVSDHHSANPYLEQFWRGIEGRGFGYIDWVPIQSVWTLICDILEAPNANKVDAVNVVVGRSFSPAEATAIVDSAEMSVCIGFN